MTLTQSCVMGFYTSKIVGWYLFSTLRVGCDYKVTSLVAIMRVYLITFVLQSMHQIFITYCVGVMSEIINHVLHLHPCMTIL